MFVEAICEEGALDDMTHRLCCSVDGRQGRLSSIARIRRQMLLHFRGKPEVAPHSATFLYKGF